MSFRSVPAQETILYSENWTKELDTFFIDILVLERNGGRWDNKGANNHALLTAQGWINSEFGKTFTFDEIDASKQMFFKRYRTFKRIISDPEVKWISEINHVDAEWFFWKKIFKEKPLARDYFHKGESTFERLDMLFSGRPESPTAGSKQIIIVSSDDDSSVKPQEATPTLVVISDSETGEEVESPSVVKKSAAKKINFGPFGNTALNPEFCLDEHSTNTPIRVAIPSPPAPSRDAFRLKPTDFFYRKAFSSDCQGSGQVCSPSYRRE